MKERLTNLFHVHSGEFQLVFILSLVLLGNSVARQVAGIVSISGFLDAGSINQFPLVLGIDYFIVLVLSALQSLIVDRLNRVKLLQYVTLVFALIFIILRLLFLNNVSNSINYAIMYIVAELQYVHFPLFFWVLANDSVSMTQSKRLFPFIASWSFIGKTIGIGFSFFWPNLLSQFPTIKDEDILIINVFIYLLIYLVLLFSFQKPKRKRPMRKETLRETLTEGWDFVQNVPVFRYLGIAVIVLAIADTIVEFQFLNLTDMFFDTKTSYQQFYSIYRLTATLLALGMQLFFTSRIIERLNVKNTFLIFPIIVLIGLTSMLLWSHIIVAISAMLTLKLVRETVDETPRKSLQSLVPKERRGRVSVFIDSYLSAIGTILGCLILGIVLFIQTQQNTDIYSYIYLGFGIIASGIAIWAILQLRKVYDSSLLNWRLKRRQRGSSVLDKLDF